MIQAVAEDEERGALGLHYTSVPNILKVLNPLFLDELRARLEEAGDNARMLLNLRRRMARIRVFDPACGSGNFLVIAYKEMRAIEAEINRRRKEDGRKSEIPLTNFRGIELRDFPAEIARLALIIAEYQCDVLYRGQKEAFGRVPAAQRGQLDYLRKRPTPRLDEHLSAHRYRREVRADDLFHTPSRSGTNRLRERRRRNLSFAGIRRIPARVRRKASISMTWILCFLAALRSMDMSTMSDVGLSWERSIAGTLALLQH